MSATRSSSRRGCTRQPAWRISSVNYTDQSPTRPSTDQPMEPACRRCRAPHADDARARGRISPAAHQPVCGRASPRRRSPGSSSRATSFRRRCATNTACRSSSRRAGSFVAVRAFARDTQVPFLLEPAAPSFPRLTRRAPAPPSIVNWIAHDRVTFFADNQFVRFGSDRFDRNDNLARVGINVIHPTGVFVRVAGSHVTQRFTNTSDPGPAAQRFHARRSPHRLRVCRQARAARRSRSPTRSTSGSTPSIENLSVDAFLPRRRARRDRCGGASGKPRTRSRAFFFPERGGAAAAAVCRRRAPRDRRRRRDGGQRAGQRVEWYLYDRYMRQRRGHVMSRRRTWSSWRSTSCRLPRSGCRGRGRDRCTRRWSTNSTQRRRANDRLRHRVRRPPAAIQMTIATFAEAIGRAGNVILAADQAVIEDRSYAVDAVERADCRRSRSGAARRRRRSAFRIDPDGVAAPRGAGDRRPAVAGTRRGIACRRRSPRHRASICQHRSCFASTVRRGRASQRCRTTRRSTPSKLAAAAASSRASTCWSGRALEAAPIDTRPITSPRRWRVRMAGVEVHATIVDALLRGAIHRRSAWPLRRRSRCALAWRAVAAAAASTSSGRPLGAAHRRRGDRRRCSSPATGVPAAAFTSRWPDRRSPSRSAYAVTTRVSLRAGHPRAAHDQARVPALRGAGDRRADAQRPVEAEARRRAIRGHGAVQRSRRLHHALRATDAGSS